MRKGFSKLKNCNTRLTKENSGIKKNYNNLLVENAKILKDNDFLIQKLRLSEEREQKLLEELSELKSRLAKNSSNSSKPPSTDIRRTKSLRESSGLKSGGQTGHKGSNLPMVSNPDKVEVHPVDTCSGCGGDLRNTNVQDYDRRQVFDLPPIRMEVTEHVCEIKCCPHCQTENKGIFPADVNQPTQYGNKLKGWCVYLSAYHFIPYERCSQLIRDLTGMAPSKGTLVNFNNLMRQNLVDSGFEADLKEKLLASNVCNADETGYYFDDERYWLHTFSTEDLTYYYPHVKRGQEAMKDMGLLPLYTGVLVHDFWKSYLEYENCKHSLCNTHHLRDLTFCEEQENNEWAVKMKKMLLELKAEVDKCKENGLTAIEPEQLIILENRYDALVDEGYQKYPFPVKQAGKRGSVKKTKSQNMMERFKNHKDKVLRFIRDFKVPFGNNIAEQAMRMTKVKLKISGCFRSTEGVESFALNRSYIDTNRKQGNDIIQAIGLAINGKPIFAR